MFLPIILIHRYGWLGFLIFSIPNVLGCAAFGYVLKTPERSREMVEKYKTPITFFAIVTIAFHIFFIAILAQVYLENFSHLISIWLPLTTLSVGACLAFLPTKLWPILAVAIWVFSAAVSTTLVPFNEIPQGYLPWQEAIWLLPITTFGFFLCPYLDPTFHTALQNSPSKHSFGVFGITFIVMIGITTAYIGMGQPSTATTIYAMSTLLGLHLAFQTIFTIGAHIKEGFRIGSRRSKLCFIILLIFACLLAEGVAHRMGIGSSSEKWIPQWQDDYLRFFVFYGLIFPGIVAVFILSKKVFTPLRTIMFVLAALFSLPLLELGYLQGRAWLTVLPVIVFITWAFQSRLSIAK